MPIFCIVSNFELADIQNNLPNNVCAEMGPEKQLNGEDELYFKTSELAQEHLLKLREVQGEEEGDFGRTVLRLPLSSTLTTVWSTWCHAEESCSMWCGVFKTEGEALDAARRLHKKGAENEFGCGCQDLDAVLVEGHGTFDCKTMEWDVKEIPVLTNLPPLLPPV